MFVLLSWSGTVFQLSTFASHLQGWGFDSHLRHVCVEFACSPRASGVSSGYSGFLPRPKDMHCDQADSGETGSSPAISGVRNDCYTWDVGCGRLE
ncbi:hypothetical protein QTP86_014786, partial [Hemibagrus guttatus]